MRIELEVDFDEMTSLRLWLASPAGLRPVTVRHLVEQVVDAWPEPLEVGDVCRHAGTLTSVLVLAIWGEWAWVHHIDSDAPWSARLADLTRVTD